MGEIWEREKRQVRMNDGNEIYYRPIAHIENDYKEKFGVPRQSGLVGGVESTIVFLPEYQDENALRGLEEFSHIWLIWDFSQVKREGWSPTVRPPRLGGNIRLGVFATRSPFRPNPIGLSCVRLLEIRQTEKNGPILKVGGADLMDGTPILDIKPYLPYADACPKASAGFTERIKESALMVDFSGLPVQSLEDKELDKIAQVLAQDPRPRYQDDPERIYGMRFGDKNIRFKIIGETVKVLEILSV